MASGEVHKQEFSSKSEAMFSEEDTKTVFKQEHILNDKSETLHNKIKALILTWGDLAKLKFPTTDNLKALIEFLKSHTLNIVLSANWLRYKEKYYVKLVIEINKCHDVFEHLKGFQMLCHKLATIAESPWKKKTIIQMLNCEDPLITIEEYNFFVHEESGYFISMRLKKLCDEGCEDIALNLTRAYIKCCEWAELKSLNMYITEDQKKFVFDVYLALLYKFDHTSEMSALLKSTTLSEGVDMVRRFAFKVISVSKIWVNSIRIAQLSGTIFLTRGVMLPLNESSSFINELLDVWLPTYDREHKTDELIGCLRRIMKNAVTSSHMYLILKRLLIKFGLKLRSYNLEIYIQALNTDLNLLEKLKTEKESGEMVEETTKRIANGLMELAALLSDSLYVSRECILSAFSLKPSEKVFRQIEVLARECGNDVLDTGQWKCKFHPPASADDDLLVMCTSCGDFMSELKIKTSIKTPNSYLTEALSELCFNEQLRDDLVVIIFSARYQLLSWLQNWNDLHRLCIMYLDDPVTTKNLITELKFLEIDYTPFLMKRELETAEQYENQIEQVLAEAYRDSRKKKKRRRSSSYEYEEEEDEEDEPDDDESDNYTPHSHKSDPEVLKTLRSFRRSLKKGDETDGGSDFKMACKRARYEMYDYSATNTESPQSSSSSHSPVPLAEPSSTSRTGTGLQIRKDIYKIPAEQRKFFRKDTEPPQVNDASNSNFLEEPVIRETHNDHSSITIVSSNKTVDELVEKTRDMNEADETVRDKDIVLDNGLNTMENGENLTEVVIRHYFIEGERSGVYTVDKFGQKIGDTILTRTNAFLKDTNQSQSKDGYMPEDNLNSSLEIKEGDSEPIPGEEVKAKAQDCEVNSVCGEETIKEKFNLKDCSVVLNRIQETNNKLISRPSRKRMRKGRPRRYKVKIDNKVTENKIYLHKSIDENYNSSYNPQFQNNYRISIVPNKYENCLEDLKRKLLVSSDKMNPRVVLKRLDDSRIKSLLAEVPGISDTNLFRPDNTDQIVNVVQVAGGRTSTVQSPNTQTSTQVSPHIQRIGQPRNEKSDQTAAPESSATSTKSSANTYTITKPVSTQSPTLINILSQQIIRPCNSNSTRTRSGPLINILSQQTIRPANTLTNSKSTTTVTTETQAINTSRIIATSSDQQQIINQIVNPSRTTGPLKTVVGMSNSEQGRIVQFICKSTDGKLIPVTSFPSNRLVKVGTPQAASDSPNIEENFTKLVANKKTETNEISEALPKFQQAFGKSVYQNNVDSTNSTNITNNANADVDKSKTQTKNSTLSVQPIQGSVIYTRQMPVGQTINLIPQSRGQVFRIATTNSEQLSLVKDTVIHSKMSALLAAALQGKPKNSDSTNETETSTDGTSTTTTATRVQLTRPARIVKPVLQTSSNVIRNAPQANLSSTTLEQLREFDMVYKQVKERSSTSTPAETATMLETSDTSPQRISVTYLNQGQKVNCAPVVVVSSYSNLQPAASPALSVASQGSSSPCVTPAPTPTPVLPKVAAKSSKGKSVKNAPMHASKTSPIPKPQQKPQEDEHTTQRIFDILAEYAEQLRNSPDLNNKPAPRRRSNPPTNPSQNSKRKKSSSSKKSGQCSSLSTDADVDDPRTVGSEDSSCGVVQLSMQDEDHTPTAASTSESNDSTVTTRQQLILTDSTHNQTRNLIIADSSVGEALKMPNTAVLVPGNYIMPVSMVKGGQQIAVVSGGSKILATVPARSGPNMLLFQSFLNQNRKTNMPTVKYSTIQPISGISSQTLTGVSAQPPVILPPPSHSISTVTLGQPIAIKKIDESDRVNTELLLTISQSRENSCTTSEDTPQPDSSTSVVPKIEHVDIDENTAMSDNSSEKIFGYQKHLVTTPIATPVIAQTIKEEYSLKSEQPVKDEPDEQTESTTTQTIMTLNINPLEIKGEDVKVEERVQSVLVTAGSSNGPMLSHSPPQYKQSEINANNEQTKDDFIRNGGKKTVKEVQQSSVFCMQGKAKKTTSGGRIDREVQQICMQRRQAAIERELRLQKSLSEECEDLGVDEPSTNDLFPEALLFDSNNSPSFDQTSQDLLKRPPQMQDKEENKLTLFSDDDFMFEANQYQSGDNQLCYEEVVDSRILTNGQGSVATTCEDNTLLQTCTSMSDVTLSSPISPDTYSTNTPPPLNKYMHKYTNKKKHDRMKQIENWTTEVSSSEDTTGSNEMGKSAGSPDVCLNKRSDEDTTDGNFKVVRLSIAKQNCDELHCSDSTDCSISGRGARKSVKKKCPCCNGSEDNAISRKRPSSQQHTNNPHKKAFLNKKR